MLAEAINVFIINEARLQNQNLPLHTFPLWLGEGEAAGEVFSTTSLFVESADLDLLRPVPTFRTDATLGGGRGPSSVPSPLLVKLVGRDWLGEPEGVREFPLLSGTEGASEGA